MAQGKLNNNDRSRAPREHPEEEKRWKKWQDTEDVGWRRMRYPEQELLLYCFTLALCAPCPCHNPGQHLRWWAGGRQRDAALSQRPELLYRGTRRHADLSARLMEEQAEPCHRGPAICCYSTLLWQMSNGSNYITGRREPSCTLLWSTLLIAELLCSTRCSGALAARRHRDASCTYPSCGHSDIRRRLGLLVHHLEKGQKV